MRIMVATLQHVHVFLFDLTCSSDDLAGLLPVHPEHKALLRNIESSSLVRTACFCFILVQAMYVTKSSVQSFERRSQDGELVPRMVWERKLFWSW